MHELIRTEKSGPNRKLRVLVVHPSGMCGGAEIYQLLLAEATDRVEWDVVTLSSGPLEERWRKLDVEAQVLPTGTGMGEILRSARSLSAHARRTTPDVIVAHGVKAGLVASAARLVNGIPAVWVRHDDSFAGSWARLLERVLTGEISTSERVSVFGDSAKRVVIEPPRPSLGRWTGVEQTAESSGDSRLGTVPFVLGMGGRLVPEKGFEDAIRAIALAPAWTLRVFGIDDPAHPQERMRLLALVRELGLENRISINPAVNDFPDRVRDFDALAVLTRTERGSSHTAEWFGMVALEAMTARVPVICVESVGTWVRGGGLIVEESSPKSVAEALSRLESADLRDQIGESGHAAAGERLDAAQAAELFTRHLSDLVHRPGAGATGTTALSVVVTVRDEIQEIAGILDTLTAQLGLDDELVIVDGGSRDGTWEALETAATQEPRIRALRVDGAGISAGRNHGIAAAKHEHIACTDAGCAPDDHWLEAFRAAITQQPQDGMWTGIYDVSASGAFQRALRAVGYPDPHELAYPTPWSRLYGAMFGRAFDPARPTGRSIAFTKDMWERAGGFPEDLQTGEDVLFGQSAVESGATPRLVRDASVRWDQRTTPYENLRMYYRYGIGSGASRDAVLLGRDLLRALAYPAGAFAIVSGNRMLRAGAVAAAAVYLSVPVRRVQREHGGAAAAALVPVVAAARDLAKAAGAVAGLMGRRA